MSNLYIVTGANGHLGSVIIQKLLRMDCGEIRGLVLSNDHLKRMKHVQYYIGDVCDVQSLEPLFEHSEDMDVYVIHTAGIIDIQKHVSSRIYEVNVQGTKNMLAVCMSYHIKRFLYTSSVHAIPVPSGNTVIKEVTAFSARLVDGGYAKTKAEATQAVLDAGKEGLDIVIVHPSGIIGPYSTTKSNHLVQMITNYLEGKLPACVKGGYDFVDVRDVADGCLQALDKGRSGECYILSNHYYEIGEVLDMVRGITGKKKLLMLPVWLARIATPIIQFQARKRHLRPLYTAYSLDTLQSDSLFSHEKASKELGYQPRDMYTIIQDTVQWYKDSILDNIQ